MNSRYFDNAATTELCDASKAAMKNALDIFGNPSSFHKTGQAAADIVDAARYHIAKFIKADDNEIIFTSGGTEADNLALLGGAEAQKRRGKRVITTSLEHSAVLGAAAELEKRGFEVIYLSPDDSGTVPLSAFEDAINDDTILVSCMSVNNETGARLPIADIHSIIERKAPNALYHVDATQSFGKYEIYPERLGIDLLTFSSHKIHGPKGVGALYKRTGCRILPIIHGGEQQYGIRPGTEPTILIAGFDAAVGDIGDMKANAAKIADVRTSIIRELADMDNIIMNSPENAVEYLLNISLMGFRSEVVLHYLDSKGFCLSSGSACSAGKQSHVMSALGYDIARSDSALRIGLCKHNTVEDAVALTREIKAAANTLVPSR